MGKKGMKAKIAAFAGLVLLVAVVWTTVGQDSGRTPAQPRVSVPSREPQTDEDAPDDRPPGPRRGPHGRPPLPPILVALDTNHDGVIDADEIANASVALKSLDRKGRGFLTFDQLLPPPPPPPPGAPDFDPEGNNPDEARGESRSEGGWDQQRPAGRGANRGERSVPPRPREE